MGTDAVLIDYSSAKDPLAKVLRAHRAASAIEGVIDRVPAAQTLLLRFADTAKRHLPDIQRVLGAPARAEHDVDKREDVRIPVRYDGPDLADVAASLGMSSQELVSWHSDTPWIAAFGGFAPGFYYLVRPGGNSAVADFDIPRLSSPRTRVPQGAVGLAGHFSGVYPIDSPGGWQIIGVTDAAMWDPQRTDPALLAPGTRVYFEPVSSQEG